MKIINCVTDKKLPRLKDVSKGEVFSFSDDTKVYMMGAASNGFEFLVNLKTGEIIDYDIFNEESPVIIYETALTLESISEN